MEIDLLVPLRLSRAQFYQWAAHQPSGKYERVFGEVVRLAPERWRHNKVKGALYYALTDAATGTDWEVAVDGMTVAVGDHDFEPDIVIHQGPPRSPDAIAVPNPIIVFEVLSPSTGRIDVSVKLEAYFQLPSMQHYILVRADRRALTDFTPGSELASHPAIGPFVLDPPGLSIDLAAIYDRAGVA